MYTPIIWIEMKKLEVLTLTILCFFTISVNYTFAQKLKRKELKNTEWFADNADTICDMFSINLKVGDTLELIQRVYENLKTDSKEFGKQELAIFGHQSYANFIFNPNSSFDYFLTTKEIPFHTIVGPMPFWKWKLRRRKLLKLYQSGIYQMTLKLVNRDTFGFNMEYSYLKTQRLIVIRIK